MKLLCLSRQAQIGLALSASFAFLVAFTARPASAAQTVGPWRIVVLGSSTAASAGANPSSMGWVNRYATHMKTLNPDNEVINRAVGGYTTYHLMPTGYETPEGRPAVNPERNITYALAQNPDAIIINLPSNDVGIGVTPEQQQANFRVIADVAAKAGVPLWVTTTQPRSKFTDEKRADQVIMRDWILKTYGDFSVDFWTGLADDDNRLVSRYDIGDGTHLNNAGHAVAFQSIAAANIPYKLAWLAPKR